MVIADFIAGEYERRYERRILDYLGTAGVYEPNKCLASKEIRGKNALVCVQS